MSFIGRTTRFPKRTERADPKGLPYRNVRGSIGPDEHVNGETLRFKAGRAFGLFKIYGNKTGLDSFRENARIVTGMLADLLHMCDMLGIDFDALLENAYQHYEDEIDGVAKEKKDE